LFPKNTSLFDYENFDKYLFVLIEFSCHSQQVQNSLILEQPYTVYVTDNKHTDIVAYQLVPYHLIAYYYCGFWPSEQSLRIFSENLV
jgi:hypothetical protein